MSSYSQIYLQMVFAVQGRESFVEEKFRNEFEKYICGTITNKGCKVYAIYCNPDHIHIMLSLKPSISVSDLVNVIKSNSSKFFNEKGWVKNKFSWQSGYGIFSYGRSQVDVVCKYILNQSEHHKKVSFKDEFMELLKRFEIKYDEKYMFKWL